MSKKNILNTSKLQKAKKAITTGKLTDAVKILTQLCKRDSTDAANWVLLASVYGRMNNFQGVGECCTKALEIEPNNTTAMNYLGNIYTASKQFNKAIACYEKSLQSAPNDASTLNNLAILFYTQNRVDDALNLFQRVIDLKPNHFEALNNLTKIYTNKGEYIRATQCCEKLNAIRPDNYELLFQLANHYMNLLQTDNVRNTLHKCLNLTSKPTAIYTKLAENELLSNQENHLEKAADYIKLAIDADGKNILARIAQADIGYRQGDLPKAKTQLKNIIDENAIDIEILISYPALFSYLGYSKYFLELGENLLKNPANISTIDQVQLHYCLGRILDKMGRYSEAFKHYQQSNDLEAITYNPENRVAKINKTINTYTAEHLKPLDTASLESELPVFILGMPRTGTSLTEQILSSHADIYGAGELMEISLLNGPLLSSMLDYKGDIHGNAKKLNSKQLNILAQSYLDKLKTLSTSALRITDKMPHNFLFLGFIAQIFPQAKIIHCTRNPLDTILSVYFQHFTKTYDYSFKLEDIAHYYLQHERLMQYWKESLDIEIFELPYTSIVNNFEDTCRNLVSYVGLEWDEQCLEFYKSKRTVATPSHDQVNKKIYTSSLDRWKNYEEFLEPLKSKYPDLFI